MLIQAVLTAITSASHSFQLLRCSFGQGSPEGSGMGRTERAWDPGKALAQQEHTKSLWCGRAGPALWDGSSPGSSQQYPSNTSTPHVCCTTHPSPGPREHRKDKRFSHRTVGLDVDGSGSH